MRLGGLRRSITAKVGFFFVAKKNSSGGMVQQQRMVVDERVANCMHHRPPHTRLGVGSAVSRLRLSADMVAGADVHCAALDLDDSFYQFADDDLSAWFEEVHERLGWRVPRNDHVASQDRVEILKSLFAPPPSRLQALRDRQLALTDN